ncbi:hypothetical protein C8R45DRAFT_927222 [Mycena sanguinolenta]|nr:hypothetical protein C8R45DRAFT_927222 [Mycena sanguinolenta]
MKEMRRRHKFRRQAVPESRQAPTNAELTVTPSSAPRRFTARFNTITAAPESRRLGPPRLLREQKEKKQSRKYILLKNLEAVGAGYNTQKRRLEISVLRKTRSAASTRSRISKTLDENNRVEARHSAAQSAVTFSIFGVSKASGFARGELSYTRKRVAARSEGETSGTKLQDMGTLEGAGANGCTGPVRRRSKKQKQPRRSCRGGGERRKRY